jgi:hypothetical protein
LASRINFHRSHCANLIDRRVHFGRHRPSFHRRRCRSLWIVGIYVNSPKLRKWETICEIHTSKSVRLERHGNAGEVNSHDTS